MTSTKYKATITSINGFSAHFEGFGGTHKVAISRARKAAESAGEAIASGIAVVAVEYDNGYDMEYKNVQTYAL